MWSHEVAPAGPVFFTNLAPMPRGDGGRASCLIACEGSARVFPQAGNHGFVPDPAARKCRGTVMHPLAAAGSASSGGLWAHLAIFALVAVGWAGVPAIGGAVIAGATVAASQGSLNLAAVLVASVLGTEAGGWPGYSIGLRWGRAI